MFVEDLLLELILIDHPNIVSTQVGMQMQVVKIMEKDSPDFRNGHYSGPLHCLEVKEGRGSSDMADDLVVTNVFIAVLCPSHDML